MPVGPGPDSGVFGGLDRDGIDGAVRFQARQDFGHRFGVGQLGRQGLNVLRRPALETQTGHDSQDAACLMKIVHISPPVRGRLAAHPRHVHFRDNAADVSEP